VREGENLNLIDGSVRECFDVLGDLSLVVRQGEGGPTHNPDFSPHIAGSTLLNQFLECL
jgi:hypothetical protein